MAAKLIIPKNFSGRIPPLRGIIPEPTSCNAVDSASWTLLPGSDKAISLRFVPVQTLLYEAETSRYRSRALPVRVVGELIRRASIPLYYILSTRSEDPGFVKAAQEVGRTLERLTPAPDSFVKWCDDPDPFRLSVWLWPFIQAVDPDDQFNRDNYRHLREMVIEFNERG